MKQSDEPFTLHDEYYETTKGRVIDKVQIIRNMTPANAEQLIRRDEIAPELPSIFDYSIDFGVNKDFKIAEGAKVVEAHLHNDQTYLTLIY